MIEEQRWIGDCRFHIGSVLSAAAFLIAVGFVPVVAVAAEPPDLLLLRECIEPIESGGEPFPDGAVRVETLPDGTQTVSRGRYGITETTLHQFYPGIHASWLADPGMAKKIMDGLLATYLRWYPAATPKRIAYAHFAGPYARPYQRRAKERLAARVAQCYSERKREVSQR